MASGPGPAQRFNSNIIKISFPAVGGLVWFRVAQRWEGDTIAPAAKALVEGLPWAAFDMFTGLHGEDPKGTPEEDVPISNPVTDKMISKYLWWSHRTPVHNDTSVTLPPIETYIIDTANFTEVYNHVVTNRVYPVAPRDVALAHFKGPGLLPGQDPDLVSVRLADNFGNDITVPSPQFFIFAAGGGWTYHIETTPLTAHKRDDAANVIINLGKLFRDIPKDPVTGKKPATVEFTITMPKKASSAGLLQWQIQAAAFKSKLTKPPEGPKDDERRDYPVHDVDIPISGIPGAFNTDYLYPTFAFDDEDEDDLGTTERKVDVTVTFGVGKVAPKVELSIGGSGGGEG